MSLILSMSIFFVVITMIFVAIAFLLPEWMGITGSKAKQIIADHQQEQAANQDSANSIEDKKNEGQP